MKSCQESRGTRKTNCVSYPFLSVIYVYLIYVIYSLLAKKSDSRKTKHTTSTLLFPLAIESHYTRRLRSCRQGRQWRRHWHRHLLSTKSGVTENSSGGRKIHAECKSSWTRVDVFLLKFPVPWSFGRGGSWQIKIRQLGHDYGTMECECHAQTKCISASI